MSIIDIMTKGKYFILNKELIRRVGADAALFLSEIALWQDCTDDWIFRTQVQIEEETGLSARVQKKCVDILKDNGILKTKKQGLPARLYYFIDIKHLSKFLPNEETSFAKNAKQESAKSENFIAETAKHNNNNKNKNLIININNAVSEEFKNHIQSFFDYRKEIKKPFRSQKSVDTKIKEFISQAEVYGEQAVIESITTSIANGWQGTFIDKKYITANQKTYQYEKRDPKQTTRSFIERATDFEL